MTAINVFVACDRVHIFTDGAVLEPDGKVSIFGPKAMPLAHLGAAIAIRGPWQYVSSFPLFFCQHATFASLHAGAAASLKQLIETQAPITSPADHFEVVLAGFLGSEPAAFVIYSSDSHGVAPWVAHRISPGLVSPWNEGIASRVEAAGIDPRELRNVGKDALQIVQEQRREPIALPGGGSAHVVGGFLQHTVVTRQMVASSILHRWKDERGGKIRL